MDTKQQLCGKPSHTQHLKNYLPVEDCPYCKIKELEAQMDAVRMGFVIDDPQTTYANLDMLLRSEGYLEGK